MHGRDGPRIGGVHFSIYYGGRFGLNFCQESQDGGISKLRCRNISDRKESLFNKLKIVKTMLPIGIWTQDQNDNLVIKLSSSYNYSTRR